MHTEIAQDSKIDAPTIAAALDDASAHRGYFTVTQFVERNPAFTAPAMRNLIFKADPRDSTRGTIPGNGLIEAEAIVRLGRRILVHEGRFFHWVKSQGAGK